MKLTAQTERDRRAKAKGREGRSSGETIAAAAARSLRPLVLSAERSLAKAADGKAGEKRVHKLRGSLRKLEALVGALGCGFHPKESERFLKAVKRVRRSAGDVRDMDVAIGVVRTICGAAGGGAAAGEGDVIGMLQGRRAKAMKRLAARSKEERGELRGRLAEMLAAPARRRARLPARCAAVIALARESAAMSDAVRAGLGTPELLHELRLNLKECRTILESLGGVLGGGTGPIEGRARLLSDTFGEVNDLATLAELLGAWEKKGARKKRESVRAVGELVRAAHASGHAAAVRRARLEVEWLVHAIRGMIFGEAGEKRKRGAARVAGRPSRAGSGGASAPRRRLEMVSTG